MSQKCYECPACGSSKTIPAMPDGKISARRRRKDPESSDCRKESDSVDTTERLCKTCQHRFTPDKEQESN